MRDLGHFCTALPESSHLATVLAGILMASSAPLTFNWQHIQI